MEINLIEEVKLIQDIYTAPNPIKVHQPFMNLKKEHDNLMNQRDYHSQVSLEFFIMLDHLKTLKDKWHITPFVNELFYHSLLNQRTSEYAIICNQFSVGLVGIKMDDHAKLYGLYFILHSTYLFLCTHVDTPAPFAGELICTRETSDRRLAQTCKSRIDLIFGLLNHPSITNSTEKESICKRLCLCNQNLNSMITIIHC